MGEESMNRSTIRTVLLSATSLLASPVAAAHTQASQERATAEIIVTAQRRAESLQEVPLSVTAVTSEALAERNINDLTQLTNAAPSLQIGTDNTFSVRGVGTLAFSQTLDSSVAVAIDDVNLARSALGGGIFLDVERVEVLNGPQGLLFGKNASAGLLNIVTTRPKVGEWESVTDIELSTRDTPGNAQGDAWSMIGRQTVNIPLGANSAIRLNAIYSNEEPGTTYVGRSNVRVDLNREQYGARLKYLGELGRLSLYVIGEYFESHGLGGFGDRTYRAIPAGSVNTGPLAADRITPGVDNFHLGGDGGYWRDLETGGAQATLNYAFDSGLEISNIFAWKYYDNDQQIDVDFTSQNGASRNRSTVSYDQFSNELRIALPVGNRLSGQAGLYYLTFKSRGTSGISGNNFLPAFLLPTFPFCVGAVAVPGPPPNCARSNTAFLGTDSASMIQNDSYAAFGQLTFDATDALKLIAGARVTRDTISVRGVQNQGRYFVTLGTPATLDEADGVTNFSYKLGAQYQFTRDVMAYATYGRGYKGPGYNTSVVSPLAPLLVDPEISKNFEVGLKSTFLDRKLIFNLSLFHTKFTGFQVQSFDTLAQTFIVQNAASVTSKGAELTVIARPAAGLTLNAAATLLDTKFDDFPGAQCFPGQPVPSCAGNNTFNAGGYRTPVSPKFTSTVLVAYEVPTEGFVRPFVNGNWYHRSSINFLINRAPGATVDPIDTFGLNVGLRLDNGMEFTLFCKNCTNVHTPNFIGLDPGDASNQAGPRMSYQQQFGFDSVRTLGLSANFRF
jgi:iron complex outermembrane receptor protein